MPNIEAAQVSSPEGPHSFSFGRREKPYIPHFTHEQKKLITEVRHFQEHYAHLQLHELKENLPKNLREKPYAEQLTFRPQVFALAARAIEITTGMNLRDNQIALAQVLTDGKAEMVNGKLSYGGKIGQLDSGEGKTIAIAAAAVFEALTQESVHIITADDNLSRRDANNLGGVYASFGLKTGVIHEGQTDQLIYSTNKQHGDFQHLQAIMFDKKQPHKAAQTIYEECNIIYGRIEDFGFDNLLDNRTLDSNKQRRTLLLDKNGYRTSKENGKRAPIDNASVLVDEVDWAALVRGTEELILGEKEVLSKGERDMVKKAKDVIAELHASEPMVEGLAPVQKKGEQVYRYFVLDGSERSAYFTDDGYREIMRSVRLSPEKFFAEGEKYYQIFWNALQAEVVYARDRDYEVAGDDVRALDERGRPKVKHEFQYGLHQALLAKEELPIVGNVSTFDKTSAMTYLQQYRHFAGTSGTAEDVKNLFQRIYKKEVVTIPPHRKSRLKENPSIITKDKEDNLYTIADIVKKEFVDRGPNGKFPPLLILCDSVEETIQLAKIFQEEFSIPHKLLNTKNLIEEDRILKNAGRMGEITITTKLAGRGTDIELGGRKPSPPTKKDGTVYPPSSRKYKHYLSQLRRWQQRHDDIVNMQFEIGEGEKIAGLVSIRAGYGTYPPEDKQQQNRAGRNGEPGYTMLITSWDSPGLALVKQLALNAPETKDQQKSAEENTSNHTDQNDLEDTTDIMLPRDVDRILKKAHDKHLENMEITLAENMQKDAVRESARGILRGETKQLTDDWKASVVEIALKHTLPTLTYAMNQSIIPMDDHHRFPALINQALTETGFVTLTQLNEFLLQEEIAELREHPRTIPVLTKDAAPAPKTHPNRDFWRYSPEDQQKILRNYFIKRINSANQRGITNDIALDRISAAVNTIWTQYLQEIDELMPSIYYQPNIRPYDFLQTESEKTIKGLLEPVLQEFAKTMLNYRVIQGYIQIQYMQNPEILSVPALPKRIPVLTPQPLAQKTKNS